MSSYFLHIKFLDSGSIDFGNYMKICGLSAVNIGSSKDVLVFLTLLLYSLCGLYDLFH